MTVLSVEQIHTLMGLVVTTEPDQITCDDCFGQIGEFAEYTLAKHDPSESMRVIRRHLEQCPCCKAEYRGLLDALYELQA